MKRTLEQLYEKLGRAVTPVWREALKEEIEREFANINADFEGEIL